MSDNLVGTREHAAPDAAHDERPRSRGPLPRLASAIGNQRFAQTVARMRDGEGILPGGVVHPDVQSAIGAARGSGRPLDRAVGERLGAALGDSLSDVRIHADAEAAALARSVSARAFTVGSDIFFGPGEYRPASAAGRELLTHELVHVVQQRDAPSSGALTVSQPGDALEREAENVARGL